MIEPCRKCGGRWCSVDLCLSDTPQATDANRKQMESAAPDMLDALEYLVSLGGGDCLDVARAAIAKARGEA